MPEFPGGAWWPERRTWSIGPSVGGVPYTEHLHAWSLSGSTDPGTARHQALIVQAPATGSIIGYRILVQLLQDSTLWGGPSLMRFSCQTLDPTTGWPTGTGVFTGDIVTDVVYAGGHGSQYAVVFGEPFAVERGDLFACVWELTHWLENYTLCTVLWAYSPRGLAAPHYGLLSVDLTTWETSGGAAAATGSGALGMQCMPFVSLVYDDARLHRAPDDILPLLTRGRLGFGADDGLLTLTVDMDPVGVQFTVPRALTCDACSFNFNLALGAAARITLTGPDVSVSGDLLGVAPVGIGYDWNNWPITFDAVTLRPGQTYTAMLQTLAGTGVPIEVKGARVDPDMLTDFEGGPTWVSFGDPADIVTHWFFFLHIPGPAEELPGGASGFTVRDCVVTPVCPEEEEPGPAAVTPSVFAAWRAGWGPLQPRARTRRRRA